MNPGETITATAGDYPEGLKFTIANPNYVLVDEEGEEAAALYGELIVIDPATTMVLNDNAAFVAPTTAVEKYVQFSPRAINTVNGEDAWTVVTLPFATTPAKIADAFGFAAVDVLDQTKGKDGDVHFKLVTSVEGGIPAGTPLLVKPTSDPEADAKDDFDKADFGLVKVETAAVLNANRIVTDAGGNQFIGTLASESFSGEQYRYISKGAWYNAKKYTSSNPLTLKPFRAYLKMDNPEARIFIEEADGTITAINGVEFNKMIAEKNVEGWYTINGVKLNAAPAQKGTYIKDGKKVFVK